MLEVVREHEGTKILIEQSYQNQEPRL